MANMTLKKCPMPTQSPEIRKNNFSEVALGYSEEQAVEEASRCLNCKNKPCVSGCPVSIDIPLFIENIKNRKFEDAYEVISRDSSLPAVCGRVCPQEVQCESKCVRGIKGEAVAIGRLERFIADWHNAHCTESSHQNCSNGHSVAIIGSGPAGLSCAGSLARMGYSVTIFEALHVAGGVLVYGIPEFRLPKSIVEKEIQTLKSMGVRIETNMVIGRILTVDELFEKGFEAVFIASGAGLPHFMGIPGENGRGVYSANEFLTRINLMKAYQSNAKTPIQRAKNVAVIGGGNVAMDAARCAMRLGADSVRIVYRRSEAELPARAEEIEHAREEGVAFELLASPTEILRDAQGNITAVRCIRMKLTEPDASGRRRSTEIEGSEFDISADCVIMAIGTTPNPLISSTTKGLDIKSWGGIVAEEKTGKTSKVGVFSGGDAVTGAATVILAMGAGKDAAKAIDEYIRSK